MSNVLKTWHLKSWCPRHKNEKQKCQRRKSEIDRELINLITLNSAQTVFFKALFVSDSSRVCFVKRPTSKYLIFIVHLITSQTVSSHRVEIWIWGSSVGVPVSSDCSLVYVCVCECVWLCMSVFVYVCNGVESSPPDQWLLTSMFLLVLTELLLLSGGNRYGQSLHLSPLSLSLSPSFSCPLSFSLSLPPYIYISPLLPPLSEVSRVPWGETVSGESDCQAALAPLWGVQLGVGGEDTVSDKQTTPGHSTIVEGWRW